MKRHVASVLILSVGCTTAVALAPSALATKRTAEDHAQTQLPSDKNFRTGMARFNDGDYDGAVDSFLQSVYFARNSYQPVANFWLGRAYMEKREDIKAIEAFKKSIDQSLGGDADALFYLGQVYLRNGRDQEAEDAANKCITASVGRAYRAYNLLGLINDYREEYGMAQGDFEQALGEKPWTYTEAWINYCEAMMKQQNWVGAVQQLRGMLVATQKLVGLDYERIHLDIGICLLAKGDHQGALDNWHRVMDYNVNNAEAHLQVAMLYDLENHVSASIKEYKEFIRLSTNEQKISKAKQRVAMLQQKMAPAQNFEAPNPTPYMRQQTREQQQQIEQKMFSKDNRESGF